MFFTIIRQGQTAFHDKMQGEEGMPIACRFIGRGMLESKMLDKEVCIGRIKSVYHRFLRLILFKFPNSHTIPPRNFIFIIIPNKDHFVKGKILPKVGNFLFLRHKKSTELDKKIILHFSSGSDKIIT